LTFDVSLTTLWVRLLAQQYNVHCICISLDYVPNESAMETLGMSSATVASNVPTLINWSWFIFMRRCSGTTSAHMYTVYTYAHMHTYVHTHVHTYLHTYIPTYLHTYIHTYIHTHMSSHTYIPTCEYMRVHACQEGGHATCGQVMSHMDDECHM